MKVVCNTTPILALQGIGLLELLHQFYGEVLVPDAVWKEVQAGDQKDVQVDLQAHAWMKRTEVGNSPLVALLNYQLDKGEAEVLALAVETKADLVIIDEKMGRKFAAQLQIPFTGTLGVLQTAHKEGLVPALRPLIRKMQANGIWLSEKIIAQLLNSKES